MKKTTQSYFWLAASVTTLATAACLALLSRDSEHKTAYLVGMLATGVSSLGFFIKSMIVGNELDPNDQPLQRKLRNLNPRLNLNPDDSIAKKPSKTTTARMAEKVHPEVNPKSPGMG